MMEVGNIPLSLASKPLQCRCQGSVLQSWGSSEDGTSAGVFNEPLSDLMKVLASLVDADNHILVKGFLDRVSTLSQRSPRL